jgi:dTDP-4-amino-4,6-dideoxygalactose transaminase
VTAYRFGLDRPAIRGGQAAFPEGLPFARPAIPDIESVLSDIRSVLASRMLTNGRFVRLLEQRAAAYLRVQHCLAVSSCTAGLMLVIRAAELSGDVVIPSFTFAATAHAVAWNGLRPVFADIDPATLTLSPESVARAIGVRTSAIVATHTFGTPCDVETMSAVAGTNGIRLFYDAAHAFGSRRGPRMVGGFGDAEVFSLSPTKIVVAGEGGIIATNDDLLAERCRIGRDYANPGDYDCRFVGLNARMSEIHAALALRSLETLEERIEQRNRLEREYRELLTGIQGISFPSVPEGDRSTFKDFTVLVEPEEFGVDAEGLKVALAAEGIETRRYYAPPVHQMRAYRRTISTNAHLPVTDAAAARVITLPLWEGLTPQQQALVASAIRRIGTYEGGANLTAVGARKIPSSADGPDGIIRLP